MNKKSLNDKIKRFVSVIQELSLSRDLDAIIQIVKTEARALTGADGATFVLRDNSKCYYIDEDSISPLWKGKKFPMETCISGWAMYNKKAAVIEDIYADERIPIDAYKPTFVKSLVMVPIRTLDPIGAIGNYWAHKHSPTVEEVTLLQSLADITAVSIENIRIYSELEELVKKRTLELEHVNTELEKELSEKQKVVEKEKELNLLKSSFISVIVHEFKTPLAGILSSIQLLERYGDKWDHEKINKTYQRIYGAINFTNLLLNDVSLIGKDDCGKFEFQPQTIQLPEYLKEISESICNAFELEENIPVDFLIKTNEIIIDPKIVKQILNNLLSNALKYSHNKQAVKFCVTELPSNTIEFTITDNGIGIPEADLKHIFEPFHRATNIADIKGTGLGLSIVKRCVDVHQGTISLISEVNKGTTVTVLLPFSRVQ